MSQRQTDNGRTERRATTRWRTSSVVTAVAASAVVAYGAYHVVRWHRHDDNGDEDVNHDDDEDNNHDEDNHDGDEEEPDDGANHREVGTSQRKVHRRHTPKEALGTTIIGHTPHGGFPTSPNTTPKSWWSSGSAALADWLIETMVAPSSDHSTAATTATTATTAAVSTTWRKQRRYRVLQCRQKTRTAFEGCLPAMRPVLEVLTNTSRQTKRLKELRRRRPCRHPNGDERSLDGSEVDVSTKDNTQEEEQLELWRQIMVETITRTVAACYVHTLLFLSLTVQIHWIGSRLMMSSLMEEEQRSKRRGPNGCRASDGAEPYQQHDAFQAMLMQTHKYVIEEGLPMFVPVVRRAVEEVLLRGDDDDETTTSSWTGPTQLVTQRDVESALFQRIPHVLKYGPSHQRTKRGRKRFTRNWARLVLPDEEDLDLVWDICSSPVWEDAQEQVLDYVFQRHVSCDPGWEALFVNGAVNGDQQPSQPVAKVVAQLKVVSNKVLDTKDDERLQGIQKLPTVLELGDVTFDGH